MSDPSEITYIPNSNFAFPLAEDAIKATVANPAPLPENPYPEPPPKDPVIP